MGNPLAILWIAIPLFMQTVFIRSEARLRPSPLGDQIYLRHEPFARYKAAWMDYRYGSHTVYKIQYHFVFVTKYRHQVLKGDVGLKVREPIR